MAVATYDDALARLLVHEGGYSDHPADPGGPTNFGITLCDYRKYVKRDATAADVEAMNVEEAKRIYRAKYWNAQRCDELPAGIDYAVFDYGVNSGIGRSMKVLQRVVGVTADGVPGPQTMRAVGASDPKAVIVAICDERLRFLKSLRTWPVFGKGWSRRVADVRAVSLAMADDAPASPLSPATPVGGKAPTEAAPAVTKAGAGGAAAIVAAVTAQEAGLPWWQVAPIVVATAIAAYVVVHAISKKD